MHQTKKIEKNKTRKKRNFVIKKLREYSFLQIKNLIIGMGFILLALLADLGGPFIISRLLDSEIEQGIGARSIKIFVILIIFYLITILTAGVTRYFSRYYFEKAANKIALFMQRDVYKHVQSLPVSYFDELPAGKVVSRITNDTKAVKSLFQIVLGGLVTNGSYVGFSYIVLLIIDFKFTLATLIVLPIVFLLFRDFVSKASTINKRSRRYLSDLNANLNENIQGIEIIQSFNQEEKIFEEFSEVNDKIYNNMLNLTKLYAYNSYNATHALQYITLGAVLLYFGYGSATGAYVVSIGSIYLFVDYMTKIFDNLNNAIQRMGELETSYGAADHIFELLQVETIPERKEHINEIKGNVEFKDVSFYYKKGEYVLKDINIKAKEGETIAFVGHTGSGKSTMMNLLLNFYDVQKGRITIDGKDISSINQQELRKNIAIVLQDPFLFTGTILSNITLNSSEITEEDALKALLAVGGEIILNKHSKGINTEVKENGDTFSAGERQLISFARALAKNPSILVLDEATSNIDSETETIIQKGIERLKEGRTTFLIAHRLSTIKNADKIIVLDKGKIIEKGSHEELIKLNGTYKKMYEMQSVSE
ncbi:ABC transporter ATP-binding protein [Miniphocaeibacter massiliensis]|uniref:ABC transporter ATP-binding protein n=1 Tax=Miniphocaeibacter massiliensis TaxID=2041841 RepID=UPI000C1BA03D|nr:ABC transporter ATP-binding protein [Miniphocaeibacter massiliensis]